MLAKQIQCLFHVIWLGSTFHPLYVLFDLQIGTRFCHQLSQNCQSSSFAMETIQKCPKRFRFDWKCFISNVPRSRHIRSWMVLCKFLRICSLLPLDARIDFEFALPPLLGLLTQSVPFCHQLCFASLVSLFSLLCHKKINSFLFDAAA